MLSSTLRWRCKRVQRTHACTRESDLLQLDRGDGVDPCRRGLSAAGKLWSSIIWWDKLVRAWLPDRFVIECCGGARVAGMTQSPVRVWSCVRTTACEPACIRRYPLASFTTGCEMLSYLCYNELNVRSLSSMSHFLSQAGRLQMGFTSSQVL